ncbi:MAG TPA: relaxase/mobilization nuclease domain-containing protein [Thermoanaerobaculia bacterium]|nr:relaxase/mobilization nuclease domain-containing protein [Thermoanaerobaculia bacterium]
MINRIIKGRGFRGVLNYVAEKAGAELIGGNMEGTTPRELAREFGFVRRLRPGLTRAVVHLPLRLPPEESLSVEQWNVVAERMMAGMGFGDAPYVVYRHRDAECEHIHIVASRVSYYNEVVSEGNDYYRAMAICRRIEQDYGLRVVPYRPREKPAGQAESKALGRGGGESVRRRLQQAVAAAARGSSGLAGFVAELERQGVGVLARIAGNGQVSGLSYRLDGMTFRGSRLGAAYGWTGVQRTLGITYLRSRDLPVLAAARERFRQGEEGAAAEGRVGEGVPVAEAAMAEMAGMAEMADMAETEGSPAAGFDAWPGSSEGGGPAASPYPHGDADAEGVEVAMEGARAAGPDAPDPDVEGLEVAMRGAPAAGLNRSGYPEAESVEIAGLDVSAVGADPPGRVEAQIVEVAMSERRDGRSAVEERAPERGFASAEVENTGSGAAGAPSPALPSPTADRTTGQVVEQLRALGGAHYDLLILDARSGTQRYLRRRRTAEQIARAVPWLKHENAAGGEVLLRPAEEGRFSIFAGVPRPALLAARKAGLTPAVVIRSVDGGRELWFRAAAALGGEEKRALDQELAKQLRASAPPVEGAYGHLAGFTSPMLQQAAGYRRAPFMTLEEAAGTPLAPAREVGAAARREAEERRLAAQVEREVAALGADGERLARELEEAWRREQRGRGLALPLERRGGEVAALALAMARDAHAEARAALAQVTPETADATEERLLGSYRRLREAEAPAEDLAGQAPLPAALRLEDLADYVELRGAVLGARQRLAGLAAGRGVGGPDPAEVAEAEVALRTLREELRGFELGRGLAPGKEPEGAVARWEEELAAGGWEQAPPGLASPLAASPAAGPPVEATRREAAAEAAPAQVQAWEALAELLSARLGLGTQGPAPAVEAGHDERKAALLAAFRESAARVAERAHAGPEAAAGYAAVFGAKMVAALALEGHEFDLRREVRRLALLGDQVAAGLERAERQGAERAGAESGPRRRYLALLAGASEIEQRLWPLEGRVAELEAERLGRDLARWERRLEREPSRENLERYARLRERRAALRTATVAEVAAALERDLSRRQALADGALDDEMRGARLELRGALGELVRWQHTAPPPFVLERWRAALGRYQQAEGVLAERLDGPAGLAGFRDPAAPGALERLLARVSAGDLTPETVARLRREALLLAARSGGATAPATAGAAADAEGAGMGTSPGAREAGGSARVTEDTAKGSLADALRRFRADYRALLREVARLLRWRRRRGAAAGPVPKGTGDRLGGALTRYQSSAAEVERLTRIHTRGPEGRLLPVAVYLRQDRFHDRPQRAIAVWAAQAARQGIKPKEVARALARGRKPGAATPQVWSNRFLLMAATAAATWTAMLALQAARDYAHEP